MYFILKRASLLTLLLSLPLGVTSAARQGVVAPYQPLSKFQIGEVVGASYTAGRFLIWATRAEKAHANIFRDEMIQLARFALEIGDEKGAGFSMDLARKGSAQFEGADILQPALFGAMLGSTHPLAVMLRGMPEGLGLAEALVNEGAKHPDQLMKRSAALLNRARERALLSSVKPESLSVETRALIASGKADGNRLGRLILEDVFNPALQRDVDQRYVIQYKPAEISAKAATLLNGTKTEEILLLADSALKFLTVGEVGSEFAIGPSQNVLCGEQARLDLSRGLEPHRGEYVNFLSLDVDYERMAGTTGVWVRNPRLIAHADGLTGGRVPACATRYAANLTAKLPSILQQDNQVSQQLRDLRTLLVLQRALVFLSNCGPMSPERLKGLASSAEHFPNVPPKVVRFPLLVAAAKTSMQVTISGGVLFANNPAPLPEPSANMRSNGIRAPETPGLFVTEVEMSGQPLLRIDISTILQ